MKKIILLFSLLLVSANSIFALVTQKTNTVNLVLANVADGNFRDFRFQISGYDDQVFDFNYDQSLTGVAASFRLSKPMDGTIYLDVPVTSITINGTNAHFSIARTNIPPPGTYYGELLSYEANSTNYYRTIAQGTLPVTWSLYLNASNFFARSTNGAAVGQVYVHPNWIDPPWIGTNSGLGSIYATLNMHTTLSNWTDNINTRLTNVTANTNTYATTNWVTNWVIGQAYATGTPIYAETDPIWTNVSASITTNAAQGADAYSWGNHTLAGYLTVSTNRFDEVLIGRPGLTTTNLCGLTGVYTGVVAQAGIGFTSTAPVSAGGLYVAGYTKQNAYGSITMAVAGVTIHSTAAGAVSNWFSVTATATTNVVLSIYGDGASKSDASNVYVRLITNGSLFIADDLYIGDTIYTTNPITYLTTLTIVSNEVDELQTNALRLTGGVMTGALTNQVGVYGNILGTNLNIFANGTNVIISQTSTGTQIQVSSVVESDPSWTAASNSVVYTSDTNYLQGGTNSLLLNGSRAMYGNLDMGGQSITNVASNSIVFNDGQTLTSAKIQLYDTLDDSTNAINSRVSIVETQKLNLTGGTMSGTLNMGGSTITGATFYGDAGGLTNLTGSEPLWTAASNQVQTDINNLETSTNALDTRAGSLETATNNLNSRLTVFETNVFVNRITGTSAVSGNLTFEGAGVTQTGQVFNFSGGGGVSFGITSADAYRGDWGSAVSARLDTANTDIQSNRFMIHSGPLLTNTTKVAIGSNAISGGDVTIAIGQSANAQSTASFALGQLSEAGHAAVAIGSIATAQTYGVAIGSTANARSALNAGSVAIGSVAQANQAGVAVGDNAFAAISGIAIGNDAKATNTSVAIGEGIVNTEPNSTMLKGNLNMAGNAITNASRYHATNMPMVIARATTGKNFPNNAETVCNWATVDRITSGSFDGTNWIPGVIGNILITANIALDSATAAGSGGYFYVYKNDSADHTVEFRYEDSSTAGFSLTYVDYCSNTTNKYAIRLYSLMGASATNRIDVGNRSRFSGIVLP